MGFPGDRGALSAERSPGSLASRLIKPPEVRAEIVRFGHV